MSQPIVTFVLGGQRKNIPLHGSKVYVASVEKAFSARSVFIGGEGFMLEALPDGLSRPDFEPRQVVRIRSIDPAFPHPQGANSN
eukprot:m51a1_g13586 hypothetical protein (84) ;mRNA; r:29-329